jgi:hypothetical protein
MKGSAFTCIYLCLFLLQYLTNALPTTSCSTDCDCYKNAGGALSTSNCYACGIDEAQNGHQSTCIILASCPKEYLCIQNVTTLDLECKLESELKRCSDDSTCIEYSIDFTNNSATTTSSVIHYGDCMRNGRCRYQPYGRKVTVSSDRADTNMDHHSCTLQKTPCSVSADCYSSSSPFNVYSPFLTCSPIEKHCIVDTAAIESQRQLPRTNIECFNNKTHGDDYCTVSNGGKCSRCVPVNKRNNLSITNRLITDYQCTLPLESEKCPSGECDLGKCKQRNCATDVDCISSGPLRDECFTCNVATHSCVRNTFCNLNETYCTKQQGPSQCKIAITPCYNSSNCGIGNTCVVIAGAGTGRNEWGYCRQGITREDAPNPVAADPLPSSPPPPVVVVVVDTPVPTSIITEPSRTVVIRPEITVPVVDLQNPPNAATVIIVKSDGTKLQPLPSTTIATAKQTKVKASTTSADAGYTAVIVVTSVLGGVILIIIILAILRKTMCSPRSSSNNNNNNRKKKNVRRNNNNYDDDDDGVVTLGNRKDRNA